jgi:4'-phosphopantetheinyl transferase
MAMLPTEQLLDAAFAAGGPCGAGRVLTFGQEPEAGPAMPTADDACSWRGLLGGGVHVWTMDLGADRIDDARHLALLDLEEQERAARFAFPVHRQRFIRRHAIGRRILARYLDCAPEEIRFAYGDYDKPCLAPTQNQRCLQFSASSSEDVGCLAVTLNRAVGVDVEVPTKAKREAWRSVAETAFHRDEVAALLRLPAERAGEMFFRLWTLKEAYCKALGTGLQSLEQAPSLHQIAADDSGGACPLSHLGRTWLCQSLALPNSGAALVVEQRGPSAAS